MEQDQKAGQRERASRGRVKTNISFTLESEEAFQSVVEAREVAGEVN